MTPDGGPCLSCASDGGPCERTPVVGPLSVKTTVPDAGPVCDSCESLKIPGSEGTTGVGVAALLLALLPTLLVTLQAIYLYSSRQKLSDQLGRAQEHSLQILRSAIGRARQSTETYFGGATLLWNFGSSAFLLFFTAILVFVVCTQPREYLPILCCVDGILRGMRFGAAGAYFALVLTLGRRTLRHDITFGIAGWGAATLVAGPILAGMLGLVVDPRSTLTDGKISYGVAVLYFLAGMSPRKIAEVLEETVRRLWFSKPGTEPSPRTLPLTQLRGISVELADRLDEEGISDLTSMALADPFKLMRNTPFSMRQISAWIDEAILIVTLPKAWDALEAMGITGAIDLAWYAYTERQPLAERASIQDEARDEGKLQRLAELSAGAGMTEADLRDVVERLYQDGQVQLVWALYQLGSNDVAETGGQRLDPEL